jgi:transcriptional regulator of acetoin/glycerol metabolism
VVLLIAERVNGVSAGEPNSVRENSGPRDCQRDSARRQKVERDIVEREAVARALKDHKRNISRAAAALGVTRASLYRRMQKYGL